METMAKLSNDFDAVIREMRLPMSSSESMNSRSTQQHDSNLYPPSYDAVQNTDAKLRFPLRPQRNTESTERKFTYTSSKDLERDTSSDSEDSDTDVKTRYTIKDKPDLLKQIEALRKEQKELEQKLEIHEQHIKDLSEREPCVHKRFKSMRKSLMFQQTTETFYESSNFSTAAPTKKQQHLMSEDEHIYVQIEQIYANFHILRFPSKNVQNILGGQKNNNNSDVYSMSEVISLRQKVKQLEEEKQRASTLTLLAQRMDDTKLQVSQKSPVPGRPTSPLPLLPTPKDIRLVEVAFTWTILNYREKLQQEKNNIGQKQISCPFYLTHCGYRAQVEAYLNGNGSGTNKYMSVFLRVIKGEYDKQLKWPVNLHFVVILVNQSVSHSDSLKAEGNNFRYEKPDGTIDEESDCYGFIEFASHDTIKTLQYIKGGKIVLKCRLMLL